jgi:hypothetical protein
MTISNLVAPLALYIAIVVTSLCLHYKKNYILGLVTIAICLLYLDLPDILDYKNHYRLAEDLDFFSLLSLYGFEPGYVALVKISSYFISFEIFYILIMVVAINSYIKFYINVTTDRAYLYLVLFLSVCLYFVAFTIRTTVASIFLAYALINILNKRNKSAAICIVLGASFHMVMAPLIVLPFINRLSVFVSKRYLYVVAVVIFSIIIISKTLPIYLILGLSEFTDFKISTYNEDNINSNSVYQFLWLIVMLASIISIKNLDEFYKVIAITMTSIILLLYPYGFFQGRFMWLTSFIFIFMLAKGVLFRFNIGQFGRLFMVFMLPLMVIFRF